MRLFFLTHSVIGSIYDQILILANRQVVLMGLKVLVPIHSLILPTFFQTYGDFGTKSYLEGFMCEILCAKVSVV